MKATKKELAALLTIGAVMVGGGTALAAEVVPNGQGMALNSGFQGRLFGWRTWRLNSGGHPSREDPAHPDQGYGIPVLYH